MIRIHNSLTGRKEELAPIEPGHVRMYVCGITVYDYCHVGHARSQLVFDVVARYLRWRGYRVNYVRNITDIDDKIIRRAAETGETVDALTSRFIEAMHEDFEALGMEPPDEEPRATEHMDEILRMIEALIEKERFPSPAEKSEVQPGPAPNGRRGPRISDPCAWCPRGLPDRRRQHRHHGKSLPMLFPVRRRVGRGVPRVHRVCFPARP